MTRLIKRLLLLPCLAALVASASAFSLLGPYKTWQVTPLGYNLPGDIGGPMTPSEGYRWNVPTIYYAFDATFIQYFGLNGMAAVDAAMKVFNDLPAFSTITNDGSSLFIGGEPIPTDVHGPQDFGSEVAGLLDVKSHAMQMVIEELGLTEPDRYVWTLRGRNTETIAGEVFTNYSVIKLNYDPITLQQSSYVNGVLYTYTVEDPIAPINYADAVEFTQDGVLPYVYSAVASGTLQAGDYFIGLSQDDVAGLRLLYSGNNLATELLLPDVTGSTVGGNSDSPWRPYVGATGFGAQRVWRPFVGITNAVLGTGTATVIPAPGTNLIVQGLRPGLNKIKFKRANYDSLIGQGFIPITNNYTDTVISNSRPVLQNLQRVITQPDILFVADDLGLVNNLAPVITRRTDTSTWQNNDALNGITGQGGPGVITPQVRISFSDQLPYALNTTPDFLGEGTGSLLGSGVWGSFDENTEVPIIYPAYLELTLKDLQRRSLRVGP